MHNVRITGLIKTILKERRKAAHLRLFDLFLLFSSICYSSEWQITWNGTDFTSFKEISHCPTKVRKKKIQNFLQRHYLDIYSDQERAATFKRCKEDKVTERSSYVVSYTLGCPSAAKITISHTCSDCCLRNFGQSSSSGGSSCYPSICRCGDRWLHPWKNQSCTLLKPHRFWLLLQTFVCCFTFRVDRNKKLFWYVFMKCGVVSKCNIFWSGQYIHPPPHYIVFLGYVKHLQ